MIINFRINSRSGLTLIEVLITTVMLSVMVFTVGFTFIAGLRLWDVGYTRANMRTKLTQALELVSKSIRQASSIDDESAGSITFTADLGGGPTSYRVYMYHEDDSEPNPPYAESEGYQLRWAVGTTTYGSGAIIATDITIPTPPTNYPFDLDSDENFLTMTFTVETFRVEGGDADQTIDMRSKVRMRNL